MNVKSSNVVEARSLRSADSKPEHTLDTPDLGDIMHTPAAVVIYAADVLDENVEYKVSTKSNAKLEIGSEAQIYSGTVVPLADDVPEMLV